MKRELPKIYPTDDIIPCEIIDTQVPQLSGRTRHENDIKAGKKFGRVVIEQSQDPIIWQTALELSNGKRNLLAYSKEADAVYVQNYPGQARKLKWIK